jgi:hypothetical protein
VQEEPVLQQPLLHHAPAATPLSLPLAVAKAGSTVITMGRYKTAPHPTGICERYSQTKALASTVSYQYSFDTDPDPAF